MKPEITDVVNIVKIPYFLLDKKWQEDGVKFGRISFMLSSTGTFENHLEYVKQHKERLIDENDDNYSSWLFTAEKYENIGGAVGHVTVFHFRIRESY